MAFIWTKETSEEARRNYEKALGIVPDYALAYAGLSNCYVHAAVNNFVEDEKEALERSLYYADKAIESDPTLHEGFMAKALATFWAQNWNIKVFEENLTKALEISPSNAEIRMFNGMLFLFNSDFDRALIELKLAQKLDPFSIPITIRLGLVYYIRKDYQESYNAFLTILNAIYFHAYTSMRLAWCCIHMKQYQRGLKHLDDAKRDHVYYNLVYGAYIVIYALMGDEDKFFEYKSVIENMDETDVTFHYNQAVLYKLLNNPEKSIAHLKKMFNDKMMRFAFVQYDPFWADYTELPAFKQVIAEVFSGPEIPQIKIESDTKECLEFDFSDFYYAEAQDNYTLFVYNKDNKRTDKILRVTLANVENQLKDLNIIRCHRSYLVNHSLQWQYVKSGNNACLRLPEFDIKVPVSRSKEKEVKHILKNS